MAGIFSSLILDEIRVINQKRPFNFFPYEKEKNGQSQHDTLKISGVPSANFVAVLKINFLINSARLKVVVLHTSY